MRWISRTRSGGEADRLGELLDRGLALELLEHLALDAQHLVHRLDHVHRDADRAGLVGDRTGDRLADPPRGVGGELEALRVVELLDRPHQAEVALLDEVEEVHAPADVALGDRHDEAQVRLDEHLAGVLAVGGRCAAGPGAPRTRAWRARPRPPGRPGALAAKPPASTRRRVLDLLGPGEQRDPADLLEVHAHRVGRCRRAAVGRRRDAQHPPAGRGRAGRPDAAELGAVLLEVAGRVRPASRASCSSASTDGGGAPRRPRLDGRSSSSSTEGIDSSSAMPSDASSSRTPSMTSVVSSTLRSTSTTSSIVSVPLARPRATSSADRHPSPPGVERRRCLGHAPSSPCWPTKATNSSAALTAVSGSCSRSTTMRQPRAAPEQRVGRRPTRPRA